MPRDLDPHKCPICSTRVVYGEDGSCPSCHCTEADRAAFAKATPKNVKKDNDFHICCACKADVQYDKDGRCPNCLRNMAEREAFAKEERTMPDKAWFMSTSLYPWGTVVFLGLILIPMSVVSFNLSTSAGLTEGDRHIIRALVGIAYILAAMLLAVYRIYSRLGELNNNMMMTKKS